MEKISKIPKFNHQLLYYTASKPWKTVRSLHANIRGTTWGGIVHIYVFCRSWKETVVYTAFICQKKHFVCPRVNWHLLKVKELSPWSDRRNKLNWQIHQSICNFIEYCTVRVHRVVVVVLHEGCCRRAQYFCDCRGPFLVAPLNLTHILLWIWKQNNEDILLHSELASNWISTSTIGE